MLDYDQLSKEFDELLAQTSQQTLIDWVKEQNKDLNIQSYKVSHHKFLFPQPNVLRDPINIRGARIAKKYTLREVETLTGISNAYLSQLENNLIKNPSYKIIQKLHAIYGDSIFDSTL